MRSRLMLGGLMILGWGLTFSWCDKEKTDVVFTEPGLSFRTPEPLHQKE